MIVRCTVPYQWTIYVRATVKVIANYVVSAKPLTQGHMLTAADLAIRSGDLAQLPPGIVTIRTWLWAERSPVASLSEARYARTCCVHKRQ